MASLKGKETYKRIADRVKETGQYELLDPFDYLVLGLLQDEGTLMGGYYPIGTSVSELRTRHFKELSADQISARIRVMNAQGLCVQAGTGNGKGWQRTNAGKEVYEKWQQARSK